MADITGETAGVTPPTVSEIHMLITIIGTPIFATLVAVNTHTENRQTTTYGYTTVFLDTATVLYEMVSFAHWTASWRLFILHIQNNFITFVFDSRASRIANAKTVIEKACFHNVFFVLDIQRYWFLGFLLFLSPRFCDEPRNLLFCVPKLIVLASKTLCFRMQNLGLCNALETRRLRRHLRNTLFATRLHG